MSMLGWKTSLSSRLNIRHNEIKISYHHISNTQAPLRPPAESVEIPCIGSSAKEIASRIKNVLAEQASRAIGMYIDA